MRTCVALTVRPSVTYSDRDVAMRSRRSDQARYFQCSQQSATWLDHDRDVSNGDGKCQGPRMPWFQVPWAWMRWIGRERGGPNLRGAPTCHMTGLVAMHRGRVVGPAVQSKRLEAQEAP